MGHRVLLWACILFSPDEVSSHKLVSDSAVLAKLYTTPVVSPKHHRLNGTIQTGLALLLVPAVAAASHLSACMVHFMPSIYNYVCQGRCVMPGVCLYVCLFVCWQLYVKNTERIFTKLLPQMYLYTRKNLLNFGKSSTSGSGSMNYLKDSSTLRDRAFFHNLASPARAIAFS